MRIVDLIDINCDLGEHESAYERLKILPYINLRIFHVVIMPVVTSKFMNQLQIVHFIILKLALIQVLMIKKFWKKSC